MSKIRTASWTAFGGIVGLFFTDRVIADLRIAVDAGAVGIPGPTHVLLCWPVLLALFIPMGVPQWLFYAIVALLNTVTFGFFFFLINIVTHHIFSRATPLEANNE